MLATKKDLGEIDKELDGLTLAKLPAVLFAVGGENLQQEVNIGYARSKEEMQVLIPVAKLTLLNLYKTHQHRPLLVLVPASDEMVIEAVKTLVRSHLMVRHLVDELQMAALVNGACDGKPN